MLILGKMTIQPLSVRPAKKRGNFKFPIAVNDQFTESIYSHLSSYTANDLVVYKDQEKVLNYRVNYKGQLQDKTVTYWLAELKNPQQDPTLSDEHTEFRWLPKAAAVQLSGYKDFEDMVEYFDQTIKTM